MLPLCEQAPGMRSRSVGQGLGMSQAYARMTQVRAIDMLLLWGQALAMRLNLGSRVFPRLARACRRCATWTCSRCARRCRPRGS